jgi:hypothetical protein
MGFIRKTLSLSTAGAVAPYSRKQRVAAQTLAVIQGKCVAEVERTGTRREYLHGNVGGVSASAAARRACQEREDAAMESNIAASLAFEAEHGVIACACGGASCTVCHPELSDQGE